MIPLARIVRFAVATAMRQEQICAIAWADVDANNRTVVVRDRKDPRRKTGNDQKVPLLDVAGYNAMTLLDAQKAACSSRGRIFPYNARSVGTAFRRACQPLGIVNLHFHDLQHEGTSRLFEAGLDIPRVALVTGRKDEDAAPVYEYQPRRPASAPFGRQAAPSDPAASPAQQAFSAAMALASLERFTITLHRIRKRRSSCRTRRA